MLHATYVLVRLSWIHKERVHTKRLVGRIFSNFIVHLVKIINDLSDDFTVEYAKFILRDSTDLRKRRVCRVRERKGTQPDTLLRDGTRLVPHKESEHAPAAKIVLLRRAKCRLVSQIITRIYLAECTPQGDELIFRDCLCAPRNTWERNNRHCSIVCFLSCVIISNEICIIQVIRERKRERVVIIIIIGFES